MCSRFCSIIKILLRALPSLSEPVQIFGGIAPRTPPTQLRKLGASSAQEPATHWAVWCAEWQRSGTCVGIRDLTGVLPAGSLRKDGKGQGRLWEYFLAGRITATTSLSLSHSRSLTPIFTLTPLVQVRTFNKYILYTILTIKTLIYNTLLFCTNVFRNYVSIDRYIVNFLQNIKILTNIWGDNLLLSEPFRVDCHGMVEVFCFFNIVTNFGCVVAKIHYYYTGCDE